eukprot:g16182.t1
MIVRAQRVCRLGGLRLRLQFFGESHKQFDPAAFRRQLPLERMNAWCVESNVADRRFWEEDCGLCFTVLQAEREELMAQELLFAAEDVLRKEEKATSERGAESIKNRELRVGILCGASHIPGITAFLNRYLRSDSFWARNKESLPLLYGCASRAEVVEKQDESQHEQATQSATAGGEAAEAVACPLIFADPRVDVRVRRNQLLHAAENNLPVENAPASRWRIGAGTPTLLLGYTIVAGSFFYVFYQVDVWLFSKKLARLEATEAASAHRVVE